MISIILVAAIAAAPVPAPSPEPPYIQTYDGCNWCECDKNGRCTCTAKSCDSDAAARHQKELMSFFRPLLQPGKTRLKY